MLEKGSQSPATYLKAFEMSRAHVTQKLLCTGKVLVQSCQEVAAQLKAKDPKADISNIGYEDIGEAAYGKFGRRLVSTTVYTELLGICALLFILEVSMPRHSFQLLQARGDILLLKKKEVRVDIWQYHGPQ